MTLAVLIVAAGRGTRAGLAFGVPKQYAKLAGRPVLRRTIEACQAFKPDLIAVVIRPEDDSLYQSAISGYVGQPLLLKPVVGGETRQDSVRLGLEYLNDLPAGERPDIVLIHDAARPFLSAETGRKVVAALHSAQAAIAAVPVSDTLKLANTSGAIASTLDRRSVWAAQTPQGFQFPIVLEAHRKAHAEGRNDFTDDASLCEQLGIEVQLIEASRKNSKITTAEDLADAERLLTEPAKTETRTGNGFDVHRLVPGDHVWLCGIKIDHDHRLDGHSDADVGLHALVDALLGAIGDGDIGQHFPPTDNHWKGAPSRIFAEEAARRVHAVGGRIINVDITLLCEAPRIGPHRSAMRKAIADMLNIGIERVGVKATTTEGLGFTGRREGISAIATASVELPVPR